MTTNQAIIILYVEPANGLHRNHPEDFDGHAILEPEVASRVPVGIDAR